MTSPQTPPERPLAGLRVVVTRPAHQAGPLCRLIEQAGGQAEPFPVLAIAPPADPAAARALVERLESFDLAVFVSANAAEHGMALLAACGRTLGSLRVLAVGEGTAAALRARGVVDILCPQGDYSSEGLLGLEALGEAAVHGRRVLIFRGEGGRALLGDTLCARGAEVHYAEVYRRVRPAVQDTPWDRAGPDIAVVTSGEGLRNLFAMMGGAARGRLLDTPLLVVGERMAALARELGFRRPPLVAGRASDAALLAALQSWRSGERGNDFSCGQED